LIGAFASDSAIAMWFHYKSTGNDDQFALFSSGPAPLTRLAVDAAFAPASGNFSCTMLNAVGLAYWAAGHAGEACADPIVVPDPVPDPVPITAIDSLRPSILNAEASALSASGSLSWTWEKTPVPELKTAGVIALVEIYRDTSAAPLLRADSLQASLLKPQLGAGSGPIWVRVRLSDAGGKQTPWSAWRLLHWEAAPSTLGASGGAVLPAVPLGNRPGIDFDLRGRFLPQGL